MFWIRGCLVRDAFPSRKLMNYIMKIALSRFYKVGRYDPVEFFCLVLFEDGLGVVVSCAAGAWLLSALSKSPLALD